MKRELIINDILEVNKIGGKILHTYLVPSSLIMKKSDSNISSIKVYSLIEHTIEDHKGDIVEDFGYYRFFSPRIIDDISIGSQGYLLSLRDSLLDVDQFESYFTSARVKIIR